MSHRFCLVLALAIAAVGAVATLDARSDVFILRRTDGSPACVIELTPTVSGVIVDVREPDAPADNVPSALPADARDFTALPMAIRLEDPSAAGTAPKLPSTIDAAVRHLDLEGVDAALGFVRATFPKAWLTAGTAIVGERSRVALDGHRVSTQTRCAVTAEAAAHLQ